LAIQTAIDVTIDGLKYVTAKTRLPKYAYEYEVEADLSRQFRRAGFHHAFEPIVASGERACQLHYMANAGALAADELLIFDVGAEAHGYAADISRTVALGGSERGPTRRQQAVYDAVCEVQDYALAMLKPGTINVEYEKEVESFMGEKLRELGLIKTIEHEAVRKYFPHATTHFLGLDAHDVGDYRQPMEPGMVMVCEPGIYIPEEGIGVRIEDDLVITPDGHTVLSVGIPRQLS
jgi:Xaa-Pro aminopeptidase